MYLLNQNFSSLSRTTALFTVVIGAPSAAERADDFQVFCFLLPFCDAFSHQSLLLTPLLWLIFLTGCMLFPTGPVLCHPHFSYHLKTSCPSHWDEVCATVAPPAATSWALRQAFAPFFCIAVADLCPATWSSCQQWSAALLYPTPGFPPAAGAVIPLFWAFKATAVGSGHGPILSQGCLCRASGNQHDKLLVERSDFPLSPVHLRVQRPSKLCGGCWMAGKAHAS